MWPFNVILNKHFSRRPNEFPSNIVVSLSIVKLCKNFATEISKVFDLITHRFESRKIHSVYLLCSLIVPQRLSPKEIDFGTEKTVSTRAFQLHYHWSNWIAKRITSNSHPKSNRLRFITATALCFKHHKFSIFISYFDYSEEKCRPNGHSIKGGHSKNRTIACT